MNGKTQIQRVWTIDPRTTSCMTWNENLLENYRTFSISEEVRLGDSRVLKTYGTGMLRFKTRLGGNKHICTLRDTLFVPKLAVHLLSVHSADQKGK